MYIAIAVTTARRIHLFSSRTQKLSFATPKVLVGQLTGRIGSCRIQLRNNLVRTNEVILFSYVFPVVLRVRSTCYLWRGRIGSCRIQLRNNLVHTNEVILFLYVLFAGYKRIMVAASAITGFLSKVFLWRVR